MHSNPSQTLAHLAGSNVALEPFMVYLNLLHKWNNTYNLTAIRTIDKMLTHHVFDSLAILPWLKGPRVLDVGSGAGLPGLTLAIANPELQIVLLDSNGKKIRFLRDVQRALQLPNLEIVQSRAESYHPSCEFDTVTSRALSTIDAFISHTSHLIAPLGQWLAMKGRTPAEELKSVSYPYDIHAYEVPGITGERCCVCIQRNKEKTT